ncbi:huntingtin-like isoform X5 [Varroa jacobsoni]|uniref:huntingtin-like isoform X5 n=1 Tax=Varroa jacobsoni TaxID=62625 RepID=UPI000BF7CC28|nr:huntingtin-like isoform X5 [Varroa jacobsoni]
MCKQETESTSRYVMVKMMSSKSLTMDRLLKSIEAIKATSRPHDCEKGQTELNRTELFGHCCYLADSICTEQTKGLTDFGKLLSSVFECFFIVSANPNQNARLVAAECLSLTIQRLVESHLSRVQAELYKEIKRSEDKRRLALALTKFAQLAPLIKHAKRRPYCVNLVPCILKMLQRKDQFLQDEAVANALEEILTVLGPYTSHEDVTQLIAACITVLTSTVEPSLIRVASRILVCLAVQCRKSLSNCEFLRTTLVGHLHRNEEQTLPAALVCLRYLTKEYEAVGMEESAVEEAFFAVLHCTAIIEGSSLSCPALECLREIISRCPALLKRPLNRTIAIKKNSSESRICNCNSDCPLITLKDELGDLPASHFIATLLVNKYVGERSNSKYQVSQFSLALNCVVRCLSAEPTVLSRLGPVLESAFAEQSDDPHLVSNVLHLIAVTANVWNAQVLCLYLGEPRSNVDRALSSILGRLEDKDPLCQKAALDAIKVFIHSYLKTASDKEVLGLVDALYRLRTSTYFLLRVTLCEVIAEVPFVYLRLARRVQQRLIGDVLLSSEFIGSEDQRVRQAVAKAICSCVATMNNTSSRVTLCLAQYSKIGRHVENTMGRNRLLQQNISWTISKLAQLVMLSEDKYLLDGVLVALHSILEAYPATEFDYPLGVGFVGHLNHLMTCSSLMHDTSLHSLMLDITSRLIVAYGRDYAKQNASGTTSGDSWALLVGADQLKAELSLSLDHVLRVIAIHAEVAEKPISMMQRWVPKPADKPLLLNLEREDSDLLRVNRETEQTVDGFVLTREMHYGKLQEGITAAFKAASLNTSLSSSAPSPLLLASLSAIDNLLSLCLMQDFTTHIQPLIGNLHTLFALAPVAVIRTTTEVLRTLFATNYAGMHSRTEYDRGRSPNQLEQRRCDESRDLYSVLIDEPYLQFTKRINCHPPLISEQLLRNNKWYETSWGSTVVRPATNVKSALTPHIRMFEPVAQQALKFYVLLVSPELQEVVLQMLIELVKGVGSRQTSEYYDLPPSIQMFLAEYTRMTKQGFGRINYTLLDAHQKFLKYVIEQLELLFDQGIPSPVMTFEKLLPKLMEFLLLLAKEKYSSKLVVSVPKILKICERLLEPGSSLTGRALPLVEPLVKDLFAISAEDAESNRAAVLRLVERHADSVACLRLLSRVIQSYELAEDRWRKISREVADMVLIRFSRGEIPIHSIEDHSVLEDLFCAMPSSVFRPVDLILKALFVTGRHSNTHLLSYLSLLLVVWRLLMTHSEEDIVLDRLQDFRDDLELPVEMDSKLQQSDLLGMEQKLSDYLVNVLLYVLEASLNDGQLVEFVSLLLSELTYVLQSGKYPKLCHALVLLLSENSALLEEYSRRLLAKHVDRAYLISQWCHLLILTDQTCRIYGWWESLINERGQNLLTDLHAETALILLSDYFDDNIDNVQEQLSKFLSANASFIVELCNEPPIQQLIASVHRRKELSRFFNDCSCNVDLCRKAQRVYNLLKSIPKSDPSSQDKVLLFLVMEIFPLAPEYTRQAMTELLDQNLRRHLQQDLWSQLTALLSLAPLRDLRQLRNHLVSADAVASHFSSSNTTECVEDEKFFLDYLCTVEDPLEVCEILQKLSDNLADTEGAVNKLFSVEDDLRKLRLATVALEKAPLTVYFYRKSVAFLSQDIPKKQLLMYTRAFEALLRRTRQEQKPDLYSRCRETLSSITKLCGGIVSDGCHEMAALRRAFNSVSNILSEVPIKECLGIKAVLTMAQVLHRYISHFSPIPDIPEFDEDERQASVLVSLLLNWCEESMMEIPLGVHVKDLIRHLATSAVNEWILAPHPTLLRGEWPRPQVPCDSYLDIQVLQKFMFRCNFVGWSSRTQFEESYVTLLGVVNHITEDRCNDAESVFDMRAIRRHGLTAITSLLLQCLRVPVPSRSRAFVHSPRCTHEFTHVLTRGGDTFAFGGGRVEKTASSVGTEVNVERASWPIGKYGLGQLSAPTKRQQNTQSPTHKANVCEPGSTVSTQNNTDVEKGDWRGAMRTLDLDLNSCFQLILDITDQWLKSDLCDYQLRCSIYRCLLQLCDLLSAEQLIKIDLECFRFGDFLFQDDTLLVPLFLVLMSKMARFNLLTKLERVFEYISKHDHYSFKQFGLLTAVLVAYRHIPAVRVETSKIIVDTIVAITTFNVGTVCEPTLALARAAAFYLVESGRNEADKDVLLTQCMDSAFRDTRNLIITSQYGIRHLLRSRGMEQWVRNYLFKSFDVQFRRDCRAINIEQMENLRLIIILDLREQHERRARLGYDSSTLSSPAIDSEALALLLEKSVMLFDFIKATHSYPLGKAICGILCSVYEQLPFSEGISKVMGELLSYQQPYPELLMIVLNRLYSSMIETKCQLHLVEDWLLLSLHNLTQRCSSAVARWNLLCCALSALEDPMLRSLLCTVVHRRHLGEYASADRALLKQAVTSLARQLAKSSKKDQLVGLLASVTAPPFIRELYSHLCSQAHAVGLAKPLKQPKSSYAGQELS